MKELEQMDQAQFLSLLALILIIVGMGKLLQSSEKITFRLVVGRAILTLAIGVGVAYSLLLVYPDMNQKVQLGIGILAGVFGEQYIELLFNRFINSKKP